MKPNSPASALLSGIGGVSWGALAAALLAIQAGTGLLLALHYVPGLPAGHQSTFEIVWMVPLGWLLRGVHRYSAYSLVLLSFWHMLSNFYLRRFRGTPGRGWVIGNLFGLLILASVFTGILLPLDMVSGCATRVALSLLAALPVAGAGAARLLFGFTEGGGFDAYRFYAAHISLLPLFLGLALWLHAGKRAQGWFGAGGVKITLAAAGATVLLLILAALFPPRLGEAFDPLQPVLQAVHPVWVFMSVFLLVSYTATPLPLLSALCLAVLAWMLAPWLDRKLTSVRSQRILTGLATIMALALILGTLLAYPLSKVK